MPTSTTPSDSPVPSKPPAAAQPPAPPPDHAARVVSPHVQKLIERRLARLGIAEQDRENFRQEVTIDILYMADPPDDLDGCSKAAHDITFKRVIDSRRQNTRRGKLNTGLTDEADNHAQTDARELASGHHAQRLITVREGMADGTLTARDAEMLVLKHDGLTDAQIAEKVGVAPQTVSNRLSQSRKKMHGKWQARMTQLAALALAVALIVLAWRKREEIAHFFQHPAPAPLPSPAPERPAPEPSIPVATDAGELRRQAAVECETGHYHRCSDRLEEAAKLDPAGETQPSVRALRHDVEDYIRVRDENNAKPGYHQ